MVYCGKPSKACAECRAKRTKCDMRRPSCGQCLRTGRACSGYRDEMTLAFRDQTADVTHQQEGRPPQRKISPSVNFVFRRKNTPPPNAECVIWPSPSLSIDEYATTFFFTNWIWQPQNSMRGSLDYLPLVYRGSIKSSLSNVVSAVGLASLSHYQKDVRLAIAARSRYNIALRGINAALRDPVQSRDDQTLMTILLMGTYETYTCNTPRSLEAWTKHVNGAVAVLHLRGIDQLKTPTGFQLFAQLRSQLIANCLHSHKPVPQHIEEWTDYAYQVFPNCEGYNSNLVSILLKFVNLWSRACDIQLLDVSAIRQLVIEGLRIDAELVAWATHCPEDFIYRTIRVDDERAFKGAYHVYSTLWVATSWNGYRSIRILLLQSLILGISRLGREGIDIADEVGVQANNYSQMVFSRTALVSLMTDTCRSVPYLMDWDLEGRTVTPTPKASGSHLLLWPLYTAAVIKIRRLDTADITTWIIKSFREIAQQVGHKQAAAMAHVISIQKDLSDWKEADDIEIEEVAENAT